MFPEAFLVLLFVWSLVTLTGGMGTTPNCSPRKTVPISSNGGRLFREEDVWNYTSMLVREDLNVLILGARQAIFALDLDDISVRKAKIKWEVKSEHQKDCSNKGKDAKNDCKNYIRNLHKKDDGKMYVCGTFAFNPTCDHLSYSDGKLALETNLEDAKGKCPFDPYQRYASLWVDGALYSATSMNFRGSEPVMMRSTEESIRTEFTTTWLNEPQFIHMAYIPESQSNPEGDDDKIYLFFSETAVEYDSYSKVEVSRVARVCKGDLGGQRTLQRKWTSFLKARLDCPVPNINLPLLVQDVFHSCDGNWESCVFYGVFTPQSDSSQYSAVCAFKMEDIRAVFSKGKYKAPFNVETSFVKWVMYSGEVPDPQPGACINDHARTKGITKSLELPDKTLQFVKEKPLMDQAVIAEGPLLVKSGAAFTRIVVTTATALNGSSHQVFFIGTESGSVLKAVNYDREMLILEEIQLFESSEPIKILRLSTTKLYVGSEVGVVQLSVNECGRYHSCLDCVLARDPYCGWDQEDDRCATINNTHRARVSTVIQSLSDGDASKCPPAGIPKPLHISFFHDNNVKLWCQPYSNLARVEWQLNGQPIKASNSFQMFSDSLVIFNATAEATGNYTCSSVETVAQKMYKTSHAVYYLSMWSESGTIACLHGVNEKERILVGVVVFLCILLAALLSWNLYKQHLPVPCCHRIKDGIPACHISSAGNANSNNNHASLRETDQLSTLDSSGQPSMKYIDDET